MGYLTGVISRLKISEGIDFKTEEDVLVYLGDQDGIRQPETFQFCPLGVQLYTCSPVADYELLDCKFTIPGANGATEEVRCVGIVVQCCEPDNGTQLYRVWVKFIDLPVETVQRIQQLTTNQRFICPFCENY
jgi:hypothetical protein